MFRRLSSVVFLVLGTTLFAVYGQQATSAVSPAIANMIARWPNQASTSCACFVAPCNCNNGATSSSWTLPSGSGTTGSSGSGVAWPPVAISQPFPMPQVLPGSTGWSAGSSGFWPGSTGSGIQFPGFNRNPIVSSGVVKSGTCPVTADGMATICIAGCSKDSDCPNSQKCCTSGCTTRCTSPTMTPNNFAYPVASSVASSSSWTPTGAVNSNMQWSNGAAAGRPMIMFQG